MEKSQNFLSESELKRIPYLDVDEFLIFANSGRPCSYRLNGHRIDPLPVFDDDFRLKSYLWKICPRNSGRVFFFTKLSFAFDFAKQFNNNHTFNFWNNLFCHIYTYDFCRLCIQ